MPAPICPPGPPPGFEYPNVLRLSRTILVTATTTNRLIPPGFRYRLFSFFVVDRCMYAVFGQVPGPGSGHEVLLADINFFFLFLAFQQGKARPGHLIA